MSTFSTAFKRVSSLDHVTKMAASQPSVSGPVDDWLRGRA